MIVEIITALIIVSGLFNLFRLAAYMIAADIYDIRHHRSFRTHRYRRLPVFTVLIPAYNEAVTIEKTVRSVLRADYRKKEIIVIDDGSTDGTSAKVRALQKRFRRSNIRLVRQKNAGKGAALNAGIRRAKGELIMVLDADSTIAPDALKNAVKHFEDPRVKAIASSVRLEYNNTWLGLMQKVEYLLAYRMKRSLTQLNIEYIIGGVGSIYRKSTLKQVSGYRRNTITEDIDLSMKVVARGNKAYRVKFASDVRTTTEPVHTLKELISQRYRWKFGRLQAFIRYRHLFMARGKKHGKLLSWFQLPYAIFGELYLLAEPLFIATIIYVGVVYRDIQSLTTAMLIMSVFMIFNFLSTEDEPWRNKLILIYLTPVIYVLLPVMSYVELVSLARSFKNWRTISPKTKTAGNWIHVKRAPAADTVVV